MNKPIKDIVRAASRREVLAVGATLAGSSLLVGCSLPDIMSLGSPVKPGAFGPFLKFSPDGLVTVMSKHIEFGQGNHAGLAAIAAEELDADWDKVRVEQAPANAKLYGNVNMGGTQGTGGSSAIANSWTQLRTAGAAARAMFVEAAAAKWGVPAAEVTVANGVVG
ncbi:MAG TPA: molybdopterin cofactor-binding domain-containing protein, partial [Phenylobacterium sp.]|nr:molybdopterin cofactor-binding domain-containing protein [Phenylobacterium sp.]